MKEKERRGFSFLEIVPNAVTMLALFMGLQALRLAIFENYTAAAFYVVLSCLLDKIDGGIARRLGVSSEFGAQMDSLADFFDFGIVPGFIVFLWRMQDYDVYDLVTWIPVVLLAVCMAIRLARFNVSLAKSDLENPLNKYFFKGVPAPMAASLVLFPMIIAFEYPSVDIKPCLLVANTILVALLAGSTIPTPCFKKIKLRPLYEKISLLLKAVILAGLLFKTWFTAIVICVLYLVSIVVGWFFYYRFYRELKKR
jgi:CDP-diacylglycerol--serine O-phosphatidyltransferase